MSKPIITGGPSMIKIDGAKVKNIRENQGLTQLYIATAVGVTTDTISRWENKKYPSIKKENGEKLASALEVELEAILEISNDEELHEEPIEPEEHPISPEPNTSEPPETPSAPIISTTRIKFPAIILTICCILALLTGTIVYNILSRQNFTVTAVRHVPSHFLPGLPFPVVIDISADTTKNISYVVKENYPSTCSVLQTVPSIPLDKVKSGTIKWLKKNESSNRFIYVVQTPLALSGNNLLFSGNISGGKGQNGSEILGNSNSSASLYHWADTDKDNRISDHEILTAYDKYNGAPLIDFDLIEEIWMGTGYTWNPKTQKIEFLP